MKVPYLVQLSQSIALHQHVLVALSHELWYKQEGFEKWLPNKAPLLQISAAKPTVLSSVIPKTTKCERFPDSLLEVGRLQGSTYTLLASE